MAAVWKVPCTAFLAMLFARSAHALVLQPNASQGVDMATTYQLAGEMTNVCPAGHESVLSLAECIAAAPSLCSNGYSTSGAWSWDPVGCFVHPTTSYATCSVYFNTLTSSSPSASARWKICKSGTTPSPTPSPTPYPTPSPTPATAAPTPAPTATPSGCTLTSTPSGTTAYLTAPPGWSNIGGIYGYYNCGGGPAVTQADIQTEIDTNGVGTTVATASVMSYTEYNGNFNCKSMFYYDAALGMYVPPNGWLANFGASSAYQTWFYCPGGPAAGGAGGGAAAVGDPHLQNVHGEKFDLMKAGKHVLINIPRGVSAEKSLLRVQADAH